MSRRPYAIPRIWRTFPQSTTRRGYRRRNCGIRKASYNWRQSNEATWRMKIPVCMIPVDAPPSQLTGRTQSRSHQCRPHIGAGRGLPPSLFSLPYTPYTRYACPSKPLNKISILYAKHPSERYDHKTALPTVLARSYTPVWCLPPESPPAIIGTTVHWNKFFAHDCPRNHLKARNLRRACVSTPDCGSQSPPTH